MKLPLQKFKHPHPAASRHAKIKQQKIGKGKELPVVEMLYSLQIGNRFQTITDKAD